MGGLKKWSPDVRSSGNLVTPDELDRVEQFNIINPSIDNQWFGTIGGTQTQSQAITVINSYADYARNLKLIVRPASGSVVGGTGVVNGKDQFGNAIVENFVVAPAVNGGTTIGTKVFRQVTSGTFNFGTGDAGVGTVQLGVGTAGTTTLFGLPTKIGATTDVKMLRGCLTGVGTQTAGTFFFGGTPSSSASTAVHAVKAPADLQAGTWVLGVVLRPTYNAEYEDKIINL